MLTEMLQYLLVIKRQSSSCLNQEIARLRSISYVILPLTLRVSTRENRNNQSCETEKLSKIYITSRHLQNLRNSHTYEWHSCVKLDLNCYYYNQETSDNISTAYKIVNYCKCS